MCELLANKESVEDYQLHVCLSTCTCTFTKRAQTCLGAKLTQFSIIISF